MRRLSRLSSRPPLILFYHGVREDTLPLAERGGLKGVSEKHLPQSAFVSHLETLRASRHVIPLTEMVEALHAGDNLDGSVAITFDDGYENNFLQAAPALADFKMHATFFLSTGFIGTDSWIWTDQLEMLIDKSESKALICSHVEKSYPLRSIQDKRAALVDLKAMLKRMPNSQRLVMLQEIQNTLGVRDIQPPYGDYRFMNWDQVRRLCSAGFDIGGHTISHPILSRLPLDEAKREILGSCERINVEVGKCSSTFCYPNGKSSDYTQELSVFCADHFRSAVSTNHGVAHAREMYELKRLGPPTGERRANIDWLLFRAK
jgi:peptidoglycan/xylan/chitin deacetylase (PgdA/CDA1 family)